MTTPDLTSNQKQASQMLSINNYSKFTLFARKDILIYLQSLQRNKEIIYEDIVWSMSYIFINHGFTKSVRDQIINHIEFYGMDLDDFEDYIHDILRRYHLDITFENMRFYLEYLLYMLSHCINEEDEKNLQISFFIGNSKTPFVKNRILLMSKIKSMIDNKFIYSHLRYNIEKFLIHKNFSKNLLDQITHLANNLLRCKILYGYGKFNFIKEIIIIC